jgi:hypothetical protein
MDDDRSIIRSEQRLAVTIVALILGPLFMLGPAAAGVWGLISTEFKLVPFLGFAVMISLSAFITYHMTQNYHWVELDRDKIRGRRF